VKKESRKSAAHPIARGLLWSGAILGALALTNAVIFYRTPPLESSLEDGSDCYLPTAHGDIYYKKAGSGPPLLLVHGIGAGESSYEFRNIWKSLSANYTVYAFDLPGFGKSDKPRIDYDAEFYIQTIADFVRRVIGADSGPVDIVATSLSAAYTIALARRQPDLLGKLILVGPTGIEILATPVGKKAKIARSALRLPILGASLYNLIAGKSLIRYYLRKMIYSAPEFATETIVDHYHVAAHQFGGDRVLPSFISGYLNASIAADFAALANDVLIVWGRQGKQAPVEHAREFMRLKPDSKLKIIESAGMLPQEEQPDAFVGTIDDFLRSDAKIPPPSYDNLTT
jgi:pimeloyl-ACP methyl ester carboxylesterase